MAERRVLDAAQLRSALKGAARPYCKVSPADSDSTEFIIYHVVEDREIEIFSSRSLSMLAEALKGPLSANRSMSPDSVAELLVDVASTISAFMLRSGDQKSQRRRIPPVAYEVVTDFVIACIACLSRSRRHYMPIPSIPRNDLSEALSTQDRPSLGRIFRASLGLAYYSNWPGVQGPVPIPRAFIASPLTNIDGAAHKVIMDYARSVRRVLNSLGIVVVSPNPHLTPDKMTDELAYDLYSLDRLLISSSDLVIAVGAEHDSWGISRTVAWAEASGAISIVQSGQRVLSRILDSTSHHTYRPEIEPEAERQITSLKETITKLRPIIHKHAQDRVATCGRLDQSISEARRQLELIDVNAFEQSFLTRERAIELLSHPVMIDHASHVEVRALRKLLSDRLDPVLRTLAGNSTTYQPDSRQSQQGASGLSPQSFANLKSVAQADDWSDTVVLRLISEHLATRTRAGHAYRNSRVSGSDWRHLHTRIFGPA